MQKLKSHLILSISPANNLKNKIKNKINGILMVVETTQGILVNKFALS